VRKLKQQCLTRVFGLQNAFYGMSVGGGVSEIRLPVFVTFFQKRRYPRSRVVDVAGVINCSAELPSDVRERSGMP
jgi:hypothetical protein